MQTEASATAASSSSSVHRPAASGFVPDQITINLDWNQVLYFTDPVSGKQRYDSKTPPCEAPYPNMQFQGYHVTGDRIGAWFVKEGSNIRRPRPSGGKGRKGDKGKAKGKGKAFDHQHSQFLLQQAAALQQQAAASAQQQAATAAVELQQQAARIHDDLMTWRPRWD